MQRQRPFVLFGALLLAAVAGCDSQTPLGPSSASLPTPPSPAPPVATTTGIVIAGHVYDRAWRPLVGARVEVLDGPNAGVWTTTSARGEFRLSGLFDDTTRFRATMSSHRELTLTLPERCAPCNPNWWLYFALETDAPPIQLAGEYTLTFTADASCSSIPEEFRQRTYSATISPTAPGNETQFNVFVTGGDFLDRYDSFSAGVAGDTLAFSLGDFHGTPGVAERVSANTFLGFEGAVEVRLPSTDVSTVSAPFAGVVSFCELPQEPDAHYACLHEKTVTTRVLCESPRHQLLLQRR